MEETRSEKLSLFPGQNTGAQEPAFARATAGRPRTHSIVQAISVQEGRRYKVNDAGVEDPWEDPGATFEPRSTGLSTGAGEIHRGDATGM